MRNLKKKHLEFSSWLLPDDKFYKSSGKIITDPKPKGNHRTKTRSWWMILEVEEQLGNYLRKLCNFKVKMPEWGTHISIIRGEQPKFLTKWKSWDGIEIDFEYNYHAETKNSPYLWLPVKLSKGEELRKELGLYKTPEFGFHLTFGKL